MTQTAQTLSKNARRDRERQKDVREFKALVDLPDFKHLPDFEQLHKRVGDIERHMISQASQAAANMADPPRDYAQAEQAAPWTERPAEMAAKVSRLRALEAMTDTICVRPPSPRVRPPSPPPTTTITHRLEQIEKDFHSFRQHVIEQLEVLNNRLVRIETVVGA